jgi:hypothetical protein
MLEVAMSQDNMTEPSPEEMWSLSADRKTVRLAVPPVHVASLLEPIRGLVDFDAEGVDEMLKRLIVLRARMPEVDKQANPAENAGVKTSC